MQKQEVFGKLDKLFMDASVHVKTLYYVEPINEKEQKISFLAGKTRNPNFLYKSLEYEPEKIENSLKMVEIPNSTLGELYDMKRDELCLKNQIIMNRGDKDSVKKNTSSLYGVPSKELTSYADELLKSIPNNEAEKNVPSIKVKESLENALMSNGLNDWSVEFSDKKLITVYPAEKRITLNKDRKYSDGDPERLGIHEVGVHVLRAANGYEQPFKIFATGLKGYLPTEEGLASYCEEITRNTNNSVLRNYAARVIAVDSVCKNMDFRKTFDRLISHDLTNEQAWDLSVRAHRGGGYVKDHIYLEGLLKVKEFAKSKSDLKILYVGKISVEQVPLIKKLLQKKIIKKAKHVPYFV